MIRPAQFSRSDRVICRKARDEHIWCAIHSKGGVVLTRWHSDKRHGRHDYITLSAARTVMTSRTTDAAMKIAKRSMITLTIA